MVLDQITADTVVITPNKRLSFYLLQKYQEQQRKQGAMCWQTPKIMPLTNWQKSLWEEIYLLGPRTPLLLEDHALYFIWHEIIASSKYGENTAQIAKTVYSALQAWRFIKEWQIDLEDDSFKYAVDTYTFRNWAAEFIARSSQNNWIDQYTLTEFLLTQEKILKKNKPDIIYLAGFIDMPPDFGELITKYRNFGTEIIELPSNNQKSTLSKTAFDNPKTEITNMALWCKHRLQEAPDSTIGCVVSDLTKNRSLIEDIFLSIFSQDKMISDARVAPFNISAGIPSSQYPLIHTAFLVLELNQYHIPLEVAKSLLSSPSINANKPEESSLLYKKLKARGAAFITAKTLLKNIENCTSLYEEFTQFFANIPNNKKCCPPSEWCIFWQEQLTTIGWPGNRALSNTERELLLRFKQLLDKFVKLDDFVTPLNYTKAVRYLKILASSDIFQPRQQRIAPIQILGVLEATGQEFDYLWLAGADNVNWPPVPQPNPFIPFSLQTGNNIPHASAARELEYHRKILNILSSSAPTVYISHAKHIDDESRQESNLTAAIATADFSTHAFESQAARLMKSSFLEIYEDDPMPPDQDKVITGGARALKLQATCPFWSFAEFRLNATELPPPTMELTAIERGVITHAALEDIWRNIKNSKNLNNLDTDKLLEIIQTSVVHAIKKATHQKSLGEIYLNIEQESLTKKLQTWLELEAQRPAFAVLELEQKHSLALREFTLNLRLDRIDHVEDQGYLIIDYKTGEATILAWQDPRPEEPQLPLYAVTFDQDNIAIAFARISHKYLDFTGLSQFETEIDGIKTSPSMVEQVKTWEQNLYDLCCEIKQGRRDVAPKKKEVTCKFCKLAGLCRIYEREEIAS